MTSWMLVVLGVVLSAAAQVLLKIGVSGAAEGLPGMLQALSRWQVSVGAFLYVLAFLVYLQVLARFDLSYASPVMVGGVVLLVLVAGAVMGEAVGMVRVLGALLIVAGIALLSLKIGA